MMSAKVLSIIYRNANAATNLMIVVIRVGRLSVRKFVTSEASRCSRLMRSPVWKVRNLRQSLFSSKEKKLLCILLSDLTPSVAFTHRDAMPKRICAIITPASKVKAVVRETDVLDLVAMSTANFVDHTNSKSAPTMRIPRSVLITACRR